MMTEVNCKVARLAQTIEDVTLYRDMEEDALDSTQIKDLISVRIARDVLDQVVPIDVDPVSGGAGNEQLQQLHQQEVDWANSLGAAPRQGAVGKAGAGVGKPAGKGVPSGPGNGDSPVWLGPELAGPEARRP